MLRALTTGYGSGLGRALYAKFGGLGLGRDNREAALAKAKEAGAEIILHCAFPSAQEITDENYSEKQEEICAITRKLLELPHRRFVFVSSADVYAKDSLTPYARLKLEVEEMVIAARAEAALVLRPTTLLGHDSRLSNLKRLLLETAPKLTLTSGSSVDVVLHEEVAGFIDLARRNKLTGIFPLQSARSATLGEIADRLGKDPAYGAFEYKVGRAPAESIEARSELFLRTTLEKIEIFARSR